MAGRWHGHRLADAGGAGRGRGRRGSDHPRAGTSPAGRPPVRPRLRGPVGWRLGGQPAARRRRAARRRTLRMIVRPQATGARCACGCPTGSAPPRSPSGRSRPPVRGGRGRSCPGPSSRSPSGGARRVVDPAGRSELVSDPRRCREGGPPIAVSLMLTSAPDVVAEAPGRAADLLSVGPRRLLVRRSGAGFTTPSVVAGADGRRRPGAAPGQRRGGDGRLDHRRRRQRRSTPTPAGPTRCPTAWPGAAGRATMAVLNAGISRNELARRPGQVGESPLVRVRREVPVAGHHRRRAAHRHQRHRRRPRRREIVDGLQRVRGHRPGVREAHVPHHDHPVDAGRAAGPGRRDAGRGEQVGARAGAGARGRRVRLRSGRRRPGPARPPGARPRRGRRAAPVRGRATGRSPPP